MVLLAKEKRKRGTPPKPYYDLVSKMFAEYPDLEQEARLLQVVEADLMHGLVQTADYARAVIAGGDPYVHPDVVDRHVETRIARQQRLIGENALELQVVLGE